MIKTMFEILSTLNPQVNVFKILIERIKINKSVIIGCEFIIEA